MKIDINQIMCNVRRTTNKRYLGVFRIFIGGLLLMTGLMKLGVPSLRDAFWLQLAESQLPFPLLSFWAVPFLEVAAGILLLIGSYSRLASLAVMGMMTVATYVHLVVKDPTAFPLQPTEPIIPIFVILLGMIVFWHGSGAWSRDLKVTLRNIEQNMSQKNPLKRYLSLD